MLHVRAVFVAPVVMLAFLSQVALAQDAPPTPTKAPVIESVTPDPVPPRIGAQTFIVRGTGFKPGATVTFTNLTDKRRYPARRPSRVSPTEIERRANFGARPAEWQVVVRNPDGEESRPFRFWIREAPPVAERPALPPAAAEAPAAPTTSRPEVFAGSMPAQRARAALDSGQPAEALSLLAPLEARYAGNPDFDYLYGRAALESGLAGEAVVALQRVRAVRPRNAEARMELARAYFELGDDAEARREFEQLQTEQPPPAARLVIDRYLEAVRQRDVRYQPQSRARLELLSGYDTNANGGTDATAFLNFDLSDTTRSTASSFVGVVGDYSYTAPLTERWRWSSGVRGSHRENPSAPFVNSSQMRAAASIAYTRDAISSSFGLSSHWAAIDAEENNMGYGADFAASYGFTPSLYVLGNFRLGALRYVEPLTVQDVDQMLAAMSIGWRLPQGMQLEAGPVIGKDEPVEDSSPYGRDLTGLRAMLAAPQVGRLALSGGIGWLQADYDGLFFGLPREDRQLNFQFEADASAFVRPWTLRIQLLYINNESDVGLFEYDRAEIGLAVGWGS